MGLKEKILSFLDLETCNFNVEGNYEKLTAQKISELFNVRRNTVSHYLNQLVDEEKVIKINSRPVYFLSRSIFERNFFRIPHCIFTSFQEMFEYKPEMKPPMDIFEKLIGSDGSLKRAIEQIKASIYYPDNGLPIILCGPTGVGKSYTAELIYRYSVEKKVLPADAPFISFNCAQYADNPELISSNLFGYVKGAYTGADITKEGMLSAADGGILFLDEVHRLNAEGQEKLFTFLDQGVYRRMGESTGSHNAKVRLIFATTENLEEKFLQTFLRRIPIRVMLPGLDERGEKEKKQFVYMFLIEEAKRLQKPIRITNRAFDTLIRHHYDGNIGELKNTSKYTVATSYVKEKESREIFLSLHDLPDKILEDTLRGTENKIKQVNDVMIDPSTTLDQLFEIKPTHFQLINKTYKTIIELFERSEAKNSDNKLFEDSVKNEITILLDTLIFNTSKEETGIMLELTTVSVREILQILENSYHVKFNGNCLYAIAHFLYYKGDSSIKWSEMQEDGINQLKKFIDASYKMEQKLASQFVHLLESKLDVNLNIMDEIFLVLYLRSLAIEQTNQQIKSIILAHGYATASSIANVSNRLLQRNIFEAIDMPIDISVEEVAARVLKYVEYNDMSKGLVLLVDMGSLKEIHSQFKKHINFPIAIINNVSTQMALFLGSLLDKDLYLEEMIEKLRDANKTEYSIIYPKKEKEKAIITTCVTGIGTAIQIQKLLKSSIPERFTVNVISYDYNRLKELGTSDAIFQVYDILAIVGTTDPEIEKVHYLSLEDLISGQGEAKMKKIFHSYVNDESFKEINDNLIRNFSLERVIESITILDSEKILTHVEEFINRLEIRLNKRLTNDKKIALYVHICCLVERLIRQVPIETYTKDVVEFEQCQNEMVNIIRDSFSVIENIYNVKINIAEIGYIYDYLVAEFSNNEDF